MITPLPPGWSSADFSAWFAPISVNAVELRNEYVLARTPKEIWINTNEYLANGATSTPLPVAWSMQEFLDWITKLIAEATLVYNNYIISSTPPDMQSAVKERINYQQPPPTNDLINGGNSGLPGAPGVPGTLPPGSTLTRASATGTYWEGSNWVKNPSMVGAVAGTPGTQPTGWSISSTANAVTRTIVGTGTEDGIPYIDVRYAGTPSATGTISLQPVSVTEVAALAGETWTGVGYTRLTAGSLANMTMNLQLRERTAGGGQLSVTALALTPTGAPLTAQKTTLVRTLTDATTAVAQLFWSLSYTIALPIDFTLRFGLPMLTTTSKPFVPQLYTANTDIPRFTVNATTGAAEGMRNEPAATNSIPNSSALGANSTPASPGTNPTGWGFNSSGNGVTRTIVGTGTEDGIPYIEFQYAGTPSVTGNMFVIPGNTTTIAAAPGQTWTALAYLRLMAGSLANAALQFRVSEYNAGGGSINATTVIPVPTVAALRTQRLSVTRTFDQPTVAFAVCSLIIIYTLNQPLDITLRLGLPQLVQAPAATSAIITTNAAVTRAADVFNVATPNGTFDMVVTRVSGATTYPGQVITTGKWLVPTDPSPVRTVAANVVAAATPTYGFMAGTLPAGVTLNRPTTGWNFGLANQIRNPTALGAVAGTPGTLPTNWVLTDTTVSTRTIVGTGIEDGIPYVDIRWNGTPGFGTQILLTGEAATFVNALNGQSWISSWYARLMAGTLPAFGMSFQHTINELNSGGTPVGSQTFVDLKPTAAPLASQRSTLTRTNNQATTAKIRSAINLTFISPTAIDFTLRFAVPYLAQGPVSLVSAASDVPRFRVDPVTNDLEGLLNEPPAVNQIRNASAAGAVPGTPGTNPTNWSIGAAANSITKTIVGTGTEDGIAYIDVQYIGTPTASSNFSISFEAATQVAAAFGQTWALNAFVRLIGGTLANVDTLAFYVQQRDAGSTFLSSLAGGTVTPTGAALRTQRPGFVASPSEPTVAFLRPILSFNYTLGLPIDITLRVGLPQLVQAAAPTSPIVTTGAAAVTRGTDILVCQLPNPVPGFWDITVKRASGTTVVSGVDLTSGVGTSYEVPTDPSPVQSVKFTLS